MKRHKSGQDDVLHITPSYLFGLVALVDESWKHVAVINGEVVMLPVDVGRNDRGEVAAVLLLRVNLPCVKINGLSHN